MSDLVRHPVTQPRTGVVRYVPSILVGERPFVADTSQTITGALFVKAPSFFTGQLNLNMAGALFARAPTFFAGTVSTIYTLGGSLFTTAPTFFSGAVSFPAGPDTATLRVLVSAQRW